MRRDDGGSSQQQPVMFSMVHGSWVMFPTVGPTCVVVLFRVLSIDMRCVAKAKPRKKEERKSSDNTTTGPPLTFGAFPPRRSCMMPREE